MDQISSNMKKSDWTINVCLSNKVLQFQNLLQNSNLEFELYDGINVILGYMDKEFDLCVCSQFHTTPNSFSFCQKIRYPNCKYRKAAITLFTQKAANKMLVKLTPGQPSTFHPYMSKIVWGTSVLYRSRTLFYQI